MISCQEFEQLYRDFYASLLRILYGITGQVAAAEDLAQEAFIRLYHRLERFPTPQDAKHWLIRVAKNLAFNDCRRRQSEQKALRLLTQQPAAESSLEADLVQKEAEIRVRDALQQLPFKYRQVLVLKEYSGMSYAQIAKSEGISENNVKIRVYRARMLLEQVFNQEGRYVSK